MRLARAPALDKMAAIGGLPEEPEMKAVVVAGDNRLSFAVRDVPAPLRANAPLGKTVLRV